MVAYPFVFVNPIRFPSFSTIFRESLFRLSSVIRDRPDSKSDEYRPAVKVFMVVEFPAPILEFSYAWHAQYSHFARGEIGAPLPGCGIIDRSARSSR
jgi:hypothetical protein